MGHLTHIHSLTEFQRNAKRHLTRLKRSGKPQVLTVNGRAELVVQSAKAYQKMMDDLDLVDSLRGIRKGIAQARRGESVPAKEFLKKLAADHNIEPRQ